MATVTKGRTFVSGETVTPTKLNELVDNATVTAIQTADISDSQITTAKIADASSTTTGVTNSKFRHSAALSVIGNTTNAAAAPADIAAANDGEVLRRSGTAIGFGTVATTGIADAAITAPKLSGAQIGSAPIYGCRAWVIFDGARNATDTGASTNSANVLIRGSGNVSSVLKNATGNYTVNFTTAMPDANYATIATVAYSQAAANNRAINRDTASALLSDRVRLVVQNSSGTDEDAECYVAIFR